MKSQSSNLPNRYSRTWYLTMHIVTVSSKVGQHIFPVNNEFLCPTCKNGSLIFRDYCAHIVECEDGDR